jgi:hypothetical protein
MSVMTDTLDRIRRQLKLLQLMVAINVVLSIILFITV